MPLAAGAEDLLQVYRDAQRYDAVYAAARHSLDAGRERLPQGRALLLPTLNLSANATRTRIEVGFARPARCSPSFTRYPESASYTLTFTQPLFRRQNWLQYEQGDHQVRQAEATFGQAYQDLIMRVAQAYFDVLARARHARAGARAEGGDRRAARAGEAQLRGRHRDHHRHARGAGALRPHRRAGDRGAERPRKQAPRAAAHHRQGAPASSRTLRADVKLTPPNPNDMQAWVELAEKQGYPVQIAEAAAEVAALEAKRNRAAHLPTLDFVATPRPDRPERHDRTARSGATSRSTVIGLQLAMPLYQGGGLTSRDRESAALSLKSREDLENARRNAALAARQNFLLVINGIALVSALEQALVSSQSALDSNKLGYEVGVRINIDVLNAQQQLFLTRRDLAVARYSTITSQPAPQGRRRQRCAKRTSSG